MDFEAWTKTVPEAITSDILWKMRVYRLALFASDLGWRDVTDLLEDRRTIALSDQLYRALGSISANIAGGYSRGTGRDRARFYEYALGSARESRDWYFKSRHHLSDAIINERLDLLSQIIRLLLVTLAAERGQTLKESEAIYEPSTE
jgi:four helix bundle protein